MSYGPPAAQSASKDGPYIVKTPLWCTIVRGAQLLFAFIIMVLAGLLIHGYAMDANVFALVCGLFTFVVAIYAIVTEKVPSANVAYNIWAVLSLDLFMAILWLASMGANAALRTTFVYSVNTSCYNDGSAVNSEHCVIYRRQGVEKRAVASRAGLGYMSAIAGLSALEMLLFIATLVYNGHTFRMHHQSKSQTASATNATVEMGHQQAPMLDPNHPSVAQQYPQYETQEYKPQVYSPAQGTPQEIPSPQAYNYSQQPYPPVQQPSYQQPMPLQQPAPAAQPYVHPQTHQELPGQYQQ